MPSPSCYYFLSLTKEGKLKTVKYNFVIRINTPYYKKLRAARRFRIPRLSVLYCPVSICGSEERVCARTSEEEKPQQKETSKLISICSFVFWRYRVQICAQRPDFFVNFLSPSRRIRGRPRLLPSIFFSNLLFINRHTIRSNIVV
jgi:hypothetical protein